MVIISNFPCTTLSQRINSSTWNSHFIPYSTWNSKLSSHRLRWVMVFSFHWRWDLWAFAHLAYFGIPVEIPIPMGINLGEGMLRRQVGALVWFSPTLPLKSGSTAVRDYPPKSSDYRHTDKHLWLVIVIFCPKLKDGVQLLVQSVSLSVSQSQLSLCVCNQWAYANNPVNVLGTNGWCLLRLIPALMQFNFRSSDDRKIPIWLPAVTHFYRHLCTIITFKLFWTETIRPHSVYSLGADFSKININIYAAKWLIILKI